MENKNYFFVPENSFVKIPNVANDEKVIVSSYGLAEVFIGDVNTKGQEVNYSFYEYIDGDVIVVNLQRTVNVYVRAVNTYAFALKNPIASSNAIPVFSGSKFTYVSNTIVDLTPVSATDLLNGIVVYKIPNSVASPYATISLPTGNELLESGFFFNAGDCREWVLLNYGLTANNEVDIYVNPIRTDHDVLGNIYLRADDNNISALGRSSMKLITRYNGNPPTFGNIGVELFTTFVS